MNKEDEEYWKSLNLSWVSLWIDEMIKKWESKGLTKEQIIEELKKYGDVAEIKKG